MANGIYVAVSGSIAQLDKLDVIANTMAHTSTTGFKREIMTFESVRHVKPGDPVDIADLDDKNFVTARKTYVQLEQGTITKTGNPLDIAITGNGFMRVATPGGERLTRNGTLMLNANGELMTNRGQPVLDKSGDRIILPVDRVVQIDRQGYIRHREEILAKIGFVGLKEDAKVTKDAKGNFNVPAITEQAPLSPNFGVLQGHLEQSNVNAVSTMVELISTQRNFEALHKVIDTYQRMDRSANRVTR